MTLEQLWEKFRSYPDRLEVFNRNTNCLYDIEEGLKMEDFVADNGNLTVVYFEVNFYMSVLHVELE